MRRNSLILALAAIAVLAAIPAPSLAQEEAAPEAPALSIVAVHVEPEQPAADTLCRLRVKIGNRGEEIATQLGFSVAINGQKLPVYENQLFMYPLAPGSESEVVLYNFWSTETSRPEPASGKLAIEVTLREARWMDISLEEETETWTPVGDVAGLPVSASITVPLAKKSSG